MSERYFITGVQLGILKVCDVVERKDIVNVIISKQFIGCFPTDKDKDWFEKKIEKLKLLKRLRND